MPPITQKRLLKKHPELVYTTKTDFKSVMRQEERHLEDARPD